MFSPGRKGQARRGCPVGEGLVFSVLPPARHWGPSCPSDHLHLAVNSSALVFSVQLSLSVSLFHLPRNFPSFSLSYLNYAHLMVEETKYQRI